MFSIIFIWEISQELSEPYQSAVTKVITCKDAVAAFFIHPRHLSEISPPLRSDQFVVRCLLDFFFSTFFFLKKDVMGKHKQKQKAEREWYLWYCAVKSCQFFCVCVSICGLYWTWWQASHRLYSILHVAMETMKTSHLTCQSNSFISIFLLAKFQLVSCNLSLALIWQI